MVNFRGLVAPLVLGGIFQAAAVQYYFSEQDVESRVQRISEVPNGGIAEIKSAAKAAGELGWPLVLGAGLCALTRRPVNRVVSKQFDKFFDKNFNFFFPGLD
ncbi:MAG TPA: hypothetical protein PKI93_05820 [Alphaproteobacteria bacterium]|nr:hypothetical protein [Alphaproteobacteria bacterium]HNS44450.1 hypothetical protein [Alphaproteobacteria bacterium]